MIYRQGMIDSVKVFMMFGVCVAATSCHRPEALPRGGPLLEEGRFIVTYEANPALYPKGEPNHWDSGVIESGDIFYDEGTYYWYYHGEPASVAYVYNVGVATSKSPTGPWKRHGDKPILHTRENSWEDFYVACANVMKEGDTYYMIYNGVRETAPDVEDCAVGIATADHPLGPWTRYAGNPVARFPPTRQGSGGGFYIGGVLKVKGTYYMYMSQYNELAYDYGYMYMATAPALTGPWTLDTEPILKPRDQWDKLGYSEADVVYYNGAFHMFYGATSDEGDRPESIGYAWSRDGLHWNHFGNQPVVPTSGLPPASAFAEVHTRIEYPHIYVYYTLRWKKALNFPEDANDPHGCPWCEHLGVSRITITP